MFRPFRRRQSAQGRPLPYNTVTPARAQHG